MIKKISVFLEKIDSLTEREKTNIIMIIVLFVVFMIGRGQS